MKKERSNKEEEIGEEKQLLQPKIDVVFQSLFNKDNMEITKSFVEVLLEEKIETIEINADKDLIREKPEDKLGILDLELDVNNKEKIDVEIQLSKRTDFIKRILWYLTRMYSKQIKRGEKYKELKKVRMDEESLRDEGYEEGVKEGVKEGKKEGLTEIAKKLIEEGKDIKYIVDLTGLEEKEIKELTETITL